MTLENTEAEIEVIFLRLRQELLKLKQQGAVSKSKRLSKAKIRVLAFKVTVDKLKTLSYQEFEALCKQHKI